MSLHSTSLADTCQPLAVGQPLQRLQENRAIHPASCYWTARGSPAPLVSPEPQEARVNRHISSRKCKNTGWKKSGLSQLKLNTACHAILRSAVQRVRRPPGYRWSVYSWRELAADGRPQQSGSPQDSHWKSREQSLQ